MVIEDCRWQYNEFRPHSKLGCQSPTGFAAQAHPASAPVGLRPPCAESGQTSRTLALIIGRSNSFFDIGSNIGIYSVYAGVKFPQVKTFAFEPVPVIWEKNRAFHRANNLPESSVQNLAIGARTGGQKMILPIYTTGLEEEQTATLCENSWQSREANTEEFEIQCTTLDAFTSEQPIPEGPCCLKIDVENFEAAVLSGGKNFIAQRRPWMVCEILPGQMIDPATGTRSNDNQEVTQLIEELKYVPFAITTDGFFRMATDDFTRPRGMKDFLLVPVEKFPMDTCYFDLSSLGEVLESPL